MFLLDEIFSSELRSRVAPADVFLKLECLIQSKDYLENGNIKFQRKEQVESENEQQRRGKENLALCEYLVNGYLSVREAV